MTECRHRDDRSDTALTTPLFEVRAAGARSLHLFGELDVAGAWVLAGALDPLIASGGVIELDLAALRFMDSTGVKAICDATQRLGPRGRIRVVNPQPGVQRVIEISGLDGMFDVLAARRPPT